MSVMFDVGADTHTAVPCRTHFDIKEVEGVVIAGAADDCVQLRH